MDRLKIDEIESEGLLRNERKRTQPRPRHVLWVSVALNVLFLVLCAYVWRGGTWAKHSSYEHGFLSDLEPARARISMKQYRFGGGVELDEHGHFSTDQSMNKWVGMPSPEVDRAWYDLLGGMNIDLHPSEADLAGRTYQWPESGMFFTGLEVYHSLHCLNRLRQALYPEYYDVFRHPGDPSREDHIGHCINHIRQALQCHADLTPMEWKQSGNKIILNTATEHTCRDFDKVHEWAVQRGTRFDDIEAVRNGSLIVVD